MLFYLNNYEGKADTLTISIDDKGKQPKDTPCKFCVISNFDVLNDLSFTYDIADSAIFYGFNGTISAQIKAGKESMLLPISNLNQLVLKSNPNTTKTVWITYFY